MSKFVTAADKNGLGLRLCWRSGEIDTVVLEDAQAKVVGDRKKNSDGVHIRLGVQVVPLQAWEHLNLNAELQEVERALAEGKQPVLNKAMKALADRVIERSADASVTLVDCASAWALSKASAQDYGDLLKKRKIRPAQLLRELKDKADEENVAIRNPDWPVLGNHILVALGLKPVRLGRSASSKAGAGEEDDAEDDFEDGVTEFPDEFPEPEAEADAGA